MPHAEIKGDCRQIGWLPVGVQLECLARDADWSFAQKTEGNSFTRNLRIQQNSPNEE